ncbi:sensor histidine kinase [Streptomyces spinosirectus]|jgi:signal transduction histidine kinase|uniref:sensor histidine kinase n=1 Tax=Streptomyces TaxID=1883 RepID=UPI000D33555D|nr:MULTISPECIES: sensor histidine kinase [Streptomyces]MBY8342093.1 sensor histidine kinase [Streptomyces plumbidurans]PTM94592.1 signal transduction histidine kinase [Streptomyces sp. VMFN-G11Ma]UIR16885.1 sensor histidine kinase [Streptomyces spinosirectus]
MNGPTHAVGAYTWDRSFRLWDTYFALIWLATLAFVLGTGQPGWPVRLTAAALLLPLIPLYVWVGRPLLRGDPPTERQALLYLLAMTALFLPSAILVGETRVMTFALVPQCFMTLRMRWAITVVAVLNVVPVVGWALLWWPSGQDVFFNGLFAVVSLVFSVAFGTWVIRIIDQSQERAALIAELDASRHEISRLSAAHGALTERERMAREIHDTLAQGFTSVLMLIQAVEAELDHDVPQARRHLALMDETARQNLAEARALVAGAAPADLDGSSLPDALHRLAARHGATLEVTGPVRQLPAAPEVVALRACQEALSNARKHAGSSASVGIALAYRDDTLTVSVRDDGCGFDPGAPSAGYGLAGLRARATEVGGTARIRSTPGDGTTVTVRLPVTPSSPLSPLRSSP